MVALTPSFKITANGDDVTKALQANLVSISLSDEDGEQSDELTLRVAGLWQRPSYGDELKVWLGYMETGLAYMGMFVVQTTEREDNNILTITATGADFSGMKERRDAQYEEMSLSDIAGEIAGRHGLDVKSDCDEVLKYVGQSGESDLAFMQRMAEQHNLVFSVKNGTLLLLKRVKNEKKSGDLPVFEVTAKECTKLRIKHSNRQQYGSCLAVWHDTKTNQKKEVTVGNGNPVLRMIRSFRDENEAKVKAEAALEAANRGVVGGSLTIRGSAIFAGGTLSLKNSIEDDGEYTIRSVSHEFGGGWETTVNFEN